MNNLNNFLEQSNANNITSNRIYRVNREYLFYDFNGGWVMTEIKEAAKKHVTDQVYEEWFETLSPAQDKALLNLFHKTYEAGANFMLEELLKEPDTILGLSSRIVKLQRQIAKLTEALDKANGIMQRQLNGIQERSTKLKNLRLMFKAFFENGLSWNASRVSHFQQEFWKEIDNDEFEFDKAVTEALKSCEQYDEQTLENL